MKNGSIARGDVAHIGNTHVTVRLNVPPVKVPGNFGLQTVDFTYLDIPKQHVLFFN